MIFKYKFLPVVVDDDVDVVVVVAVVVFLLKKKNWDYDEAIICLRCKQNKISKRTVWYTRNGKHGLGQRLSTCGARVCPAGGMTKWEYQYVLRFCIGIDNGT